MLQTRLGGDRTATTLRNLLLPDTQTGTRFVSGIPYRPGDPLAVKSFLQEQAQQRTNEESDMWLEDPVKTITTGVVAVTVGFVIIATVISVLHQAL